MFPKYVLLSICAFIRVHFGRLGKSSQHSPFRCIHIFSKTSYDQWIFPKKSWKSSLFKSMLVFQLDNLFFFFASEGKDWHSHPGSRFMVSQDFGSRFVEWLDMIHVGVWFGSGIKGMPHIISMTQMQKWWFGNFMQNWSCMHLCGHSSVKFLWSCDARAQDSFSLF